MSADIRKGLLLVGLTVAVFGLATVTLASRVGAQEAKVRLEVPATPLTIGGAPFSAKVVVDDVANLGAFEFELHYDDSILQYVKVAEGPFLASSGRVVQCLDPQLATGSVHFVCVTLGPTPAGPDGSGTLATVDLKPVGAGVSPLQFQVVTLTHPNAEQIPATYEHGSISVANEEGIVPEMPAATPAELTGGEASSSTSTGGGGGMNWALWGSVIGVIGVLAVASAGVVWWSRARRSI
jgi:hypothetical protein